MFFFFLSLNNGQNKLYEQLSSGIWASRRRSSSGTPRRDCSPEYTVFFTAPGHVHLNATGFAMLDREELLLYRIRIVHIINKSILLHIQAIGLCERTPSFITLFYTRTFSIPLSNFIVLCCVYVIHLQYSNSVI